MTIDNEVRVKTVAVRANLEVKKSPTATVRIRNKGAKKDQKGHVRDRFDVRQRQGYCIVLQLYPQRSKGKSENNKTILQHHPF